jgi:hypothetical protein
MSSVPKQKKSQKWRNLKFARREYTGAFEGSGSSRRFVMRMIPSERYPTQGHILPYPSVKAAKEDGWYKK